METSTALCCAVVGFSVFQPHHVQADRRAYATTYEAVTAPKGELDIEIWSTYAEAGEVDGGPASRGARETLELEYGLTDRWDAALYNMFDIVSGGGENGYAGFKLETRYRPTDRGEWLVDPVLYLEYQQLFIGDAKQKIEGKLIVAKDFGKVNTAVNLAAEEERLQDNTWKAEVEYAAGVSYAFSPAWVLGAEAFGKTEKDMNDIENRTWIGPTLSWAAGGRGVLHGVWVTLGGGAGLTETADKYYARAIIGLQFH